MNEVNEYDKLDEFLEYFMLEKKYDRDTVLGLCLMCGDTDEQMDELLEFVRADPDIFVDDVLMKAYEISSRNDTESEA